MVAVEELSNCQTPSSVRHGTIKNLHSYKDPPCVWRYLIDRQTQALEKLTVKGIQGEPKSRLQHLFVYTNTLYAVILAPFWLIGQMDLDILWDLVIFPKGFEVVLLYRRNEVIYSPLGQHNELPKSISAYNEP